MHVIPLIHPKASRASGCTRIKAFISMPTGKISLSATVQKSTFPHDRQQPVSVACSREREALKNQAAIGV
jgi:hypothetical protein